MVWVGLLKNRQSTPTIACVTIPTFVATHLAPFPHPRATAAVASPKRLNLHNSLCARAFNLIQIKESGSEIASVKKLGNFTQVSFFQAVN
jgi:hypothetical protein